MATSINELINAGWAGDQVKARVLRALFSAVLADVLVEFQLNKSTTFTDAGLRIKGGAASAIVQANTVITAVANGKLVTKAAATDMAALVGTVTAAKFNVYVFYIDSAGVLTSAMGTEGATLATVAFPTPPVNKAAIGFVIINPTGAGNFVGGTTVLDDGAVIPNASFVSLQTQYNPVTSQTLGA